MHEDNGCLVFNPHRYTLEEGGMKKTDREQLAFKKEADWEIREYVCEENNRLTSGDEGGSNIDLGLDEEDPFGAPAGD